MALLALAGAVLVLATASSGTSGQAKPRTARHSSAARRSGTAPNAARPRRRAAVEPLTADAAVRRLARYGLPLYCGGHSKRVVALTFDDGPGTYTRLAVAKLRRDHLRATFFLVGKEVRAFPHLVPLEKPLAAFGDHTMTHPFLPALAHATMVQEISAARALIAHVTGEPVVLFRPPYEGRAQAIDREIDALGMLQVLWNVDSRDSLGADYLGIEQHVIAGLKPGSIILMHENHGQTIRALPVIFAALARDHLRTVTIPQLVAEDPPSPAQLRKGIAGCGIRARASNGD